MIKHASLFNRYSFEEQSCGYTESAIQSVQSLTQFTNEQFYEIDKMAESMIKKDLQISEPRQWLAISNEILISTNRQINSQNFLKKKTINYQQKLPQLRGQHRFVNRDKRSKSLLYSFTYVKKDLISKLEQKITTRFDQRHSSIMSSSPLSKLEVGRSPKQLRTKQSMFVQRSSNQDYVISQHHQPSTKLSRQSSIMSQYNDNSPQNVQRKLEEDKNQEVQLRRKSCCCQMCGTNSNKQYRHTNLQNVIKHHTEGNKKLCRKPIKLYTTTDSHVNFKRSLDDANKILQDTQQILESPLETVVRASKKHLTQFRFPNQKAQQEHHKSHEKFIADLKSGKLRFQMKRSKKLETKSLKRGSTKCDWKQVFGTFIEKIIEDSSQRISTLPNLPNLQIEKEEKSIRESQMMDSKQFKKSYYISPPSAKQSITAQKFSFMDVYTNKSHYYSPSTVKNEKTRARLKQQMHGTQQNNSSIQSGVFQTGQNVSHKINKSQQYNRFSYLFQKQQID